MSEPGRSIAFVTHTSSPGGGELAIRRYLEATKLPVRLVTLEGGGVWDDCAAEVVEVAGVRELRQALGDESLVVANSMKSALITSLVLPRPQRFVYWVRDGLTSSAMSRPARALTRQITAKRVGHYIANSEWTADTVREFLRVGSSQVRVVYSMCGVASTGRPRRTLQTPLRLLYLGRVSPWKAPDVAVRALSELRRKGIEATLTVAGGAHFGEDAYLRRLQRLVDAEPAATMVGHRDDVTSLLRDHDVLVHCSTAPEPFGQVVVQGLAAGLPVVATDHGGPREILRGAPQDLLYRPGDASDLARAVAATATNYSETSAWALCRAARYQDRVVLERTDEVLRWLCRRMS